MRVFIIVLATMLLTGCDDAFGNHIDFNQVGLVLLISYFFNKILDVLKEIKSEMSATREILFSIRRNTDKF
jgi:hypothetical protein